MQRALKNMHNTIGVNVVYNPYQWFAFNTAQTSDEILVWIPDAESYHEIGKFTLNKFIKENIMAIDINSKSLDFSCSTIDDLILADIRISAIIDKIDSYNYPMDWLKEKHAEIKEELGVRMKKYYREELRKLEKERKEYETKEERLKGIDEKIAKMKALK